MLTKATEYAIRGLVAIEMNNNNGIRPGFKQIAREVEAPEQYMAKILQTLTKHQFISSVRGRGGGFFFDSKKKQDLTLYEVVTIMEGVGFFTKCGFGFNHCDANNPCPLHNEFQNIRDAFTDLVKRETIQSLARKVENGEAVLSRLNIQN